MPTLPHAALWEIWSEQGSLAMKNNWFWRCLAAENQSIFSFSTKTCFSKEDVDKKQFFMWGEDEQKQRVCRDKENHLQDCSISLLAVVPIL